MATRVSNLIPKIGQVAYFRTLQHSEITANGAISQKEGTVIINKPVSLAALTLAAPTAGRDDGKRLTIIGISAFAHTVTQTTPGFNGGGAASDVATYATTGGCMVLEAYNGVWRVVSLHGVTLA